MTPQSARPLRFGIISFAHMHATSYARCIQANPDTELVAVADPDPERGSTWAGRFGVPLYADHRELLERGDIDAVIVTTANVEHAAMTLDAAAAGKHVLCEKPLATTVADGRDDRGVPARRLPGHGLPLPLSARGRAGQEQVDAGKLGRILAIAGANRGWMPGGWFVDRAQAGGGAVMDHTVHVADLIRWFTGAEFAEVYAEAGTLFHDLDIDDAGLPRSA